MRLFYKTGWDEAAVHFCPHGSSDAWHTEPLSNVTGAPGWKMATLSSAPLGAEFVVCDGEGSQWDNPPPEVGGQNYKTPNCAGAWSLRDGRVMRVHDGAPVLVISDLDNTMIGHGNDDEDGRLRHFQAQWLGRFAFNGSRLVYSTGRNKQDALAAAVERQLLRPALLICAVGTEVYQVPDDLPLDSSWAQHADRITLESNWTDRMTKLFDRPKVEQVLTSQFPCFEIQGNVESDPYRIPSVLQVDEALEATVSQVREVLGPDVEVVVSGGSESKYVDFCSSAAGKKGAAMFAMELLGFTPDRSLVCGDSGNDESMFRCPGVHGVAVGNSLPELVEQLRTQAESGPSAVEQGCVFKTKSGSSVLYAKECVAAAICEALDQFFPSPPS